MAIFYFCYKPKLKARRGGGGYPYKSDRGAHLIFLRETLKCTKVLFCGHGPQHAVSFTPNLSHPEILPSRVDKFPPCCLVHHCSFDF